MPSVPVTFAVFLACPSTLWPIVDLVVLLLVVVGLRSLTRGIRVGSSLLSRQQ